MRISCEVECVLAHRPALTDNLPPYVIRHHSDPCVRRAQRLRARHVDRLAARRSQRHVVAAAVGALDGVLPARYPHCTGQRHNERGRGGIGEDDRVG